MSELARSLIEGEIGGMLSLETYEGEVHTLRLASSRLELRRGPVTSVTRVVVGDTELEPEAYRMSYFGLERLGGTFPARTTITVDYAAGWEAGQEPAKIQQAEVLIDSWLETSPESGVTRYREGDMSVERLASSVEFPFQAGALLREYRRP